MATERGRQRWRAGVSCKRAIRVVQRLRMLMQEQHGPGPLASTQKPSVPGARPRSAGSSRIASVAARVAEMNDRQRGRVGCCLKTVRPSSRAVIARICTPFALLQASACNLSSYWTAAQVAGLRWSNRPLIRSASAPPHSGQNWEPSSGAPLIDGHNDRLGSSNKAVNKDPPQALSGDPCLKAV